MDNSTITSARERYKPERVRVLLVGEAPPNNGAFFYSCGYDNLFKEYIKAIFYGEDFDYEITAECKKEVLAVLRDSGIYLMDLALDSSLKELIEKEGMVFEKKRFKGTKGRLCLYDELHLKEPFIHKLNSEEGVDRKATKIIFVQKSVCTYLTPFLGGDNGYAIVGGDIPFPAHSKENVHNFEKRMNEAMREAMGEEGFNELKRKIGKKINFRKKDKNLHFWGC